MINENLLKPEERAVYALRSLYHRYGYLPYKMSKFEEYDLYVKNKDFLISEGIITFTDTRGKLLALKPDVTLSIIKNSKDVGDALSKVYYNENVYRIAKGSREYREILQTGLECIGAIDAYHVTEVLVLAARSLAILSPSYVLSVSHVGLLSALLSPFALSEKAEKKLLSAVEKKNAGEIAALLSVGELTEGAAALAECLLREYKTIAEARAALSPYLTSATAVDAFAEFAALMDALADLGMASQTRIDFSVVNYSGYYSGIAFKGYIKGIPDSVLAGGQYDRIMRKMGRRDGAVGFAVYLDALSALERSTVEYDADVLLLKNGASTSAVLRAVEALSADGSSVTVLDAAPTELRAKRTVILEGEEVVEHGND